MIFLCSILMLALRVLVSPWFQLDHVWKTSEADHLLNAMVMADATITLLPFHTGKNCFVHPIFCFWSLLVTKLRKYYVIFVYILQGKLGKSEIKGKKIKKLKWPKYQNQKRKYGMNETYELWVANCQLSFSK